MARTPYPTHHGDFVQGGHLPFRDPVLVGRLHELCPAVVGPVDAALHPLGLLVVGEEVGEGPAAGDQESLQRP
ncbi:hypothetical protein ACH4U7_32870 [Streptomyces sp. NPDC020845]|uniref:hypothetical protein n=1 Tax=Streptomyces sp. NPDC020845 TaxID=3365096 RepID=UPI003794CAD9